VETTLGLRNTMDLSCRMTRNLSVIR
jgi:hypothetical protein